MSEATEHVTVECRDVWKSFGKAGGAPALKELIVRKEGPKLHDLSRKWALQGVDLSVRPGESIGICGHNGSGKSTLLTLLLGSIKPEKGEIITRGRVASLIELGAGFHPDLTGIENIYLYGSIMGLPLKTIRERLPGIIDFSELGEAVGNPIRTYSAGMTARLGFATITMVDAEVFLIDEVLAVGDASFQSKCLAFLKQYKADGGTLVIVSHSMPTLVEMCDKGICLDEGKVVSQGPIRDVVGDYLGMIHDELMARYGSLDRVPRSETHLEDVRVGRPPEDHVAPPEPGDAVPTNLELLQARRGPQVAEEALELKRIIQAQGPGEGAGAEVDPETPPPEEASKS